MVFIERFPLPPAGRALPATGAAQPVRVAIKDLVDLAGLPTTAGSRVVADRAAPASADAACLAEIRARESAGTVVLVGKTGLHELAFGVSGINPWFGTPTNPVDPRRIPGGSSSGSAVAVAVGDADVALGTDTGGSIRIPAACCAVAGLKATHGRIPTAGVWPLAPTLDAVGPMARDVAGLVLGLSLLDPSFTPVDVAGAEARCARLRVRATPEIDAAIDTALATAELEVHQLDDPSGWDAAQRAANTVLLAEAWAGIGDLADQGVGEDVAVRLRQGAAISRAELDEARTAGAHWRLLLIETISAHGPVALPVLADTPPLLEDAARTGSIRHTLPVNLAGLPVVAIPVPGAGFPASLQLVGLPGGEAALLALAARIEAAISA